jgi:hypothetical protein
LSSLTKSIAPVTFNPIERESELKWNGMLNECWYNSISRFLKMQFWDRLFYPE